MYRNPINPKPFIWKYSRIIRNRSTVLTTGFRFVWPSDKCCIQVWRPNNGFLHAILIEQFANITIVFFICLYCITKLRYKNIVEFRFEVEFRNSILSVTERHELCTFFFIKNQFLESQIHLQLHLMKLQEEQYM